MNRNITVVILCGGKGLRMSELTESMPKPLVRIGDKPILWHIMKTYAHYGFNNFVLCLGYKANQIENYFADNREWNITFTDTGLNTNTGGRIKRIEQHINNSPFCVTYADGLADINLNDLLGFHKQHNEIATITTVRPRSPFGILELDHNSRVTSFAEKPVLDHWINGGFFVFDMDIFSYIKENDTLEEEVFERLVQDKQISAYKHRGFWKCMDTYKDNLELNEMYTSNKVKWTI